MAHTGCREAPPARRTRWVFCWGYLSLSWAAARERSPLKPRAPRLKCEIVQTQGTRLNKISLARGQRPWGEVLFRRRPRSRRSSNEVAPSAWGGGGARDLRSRFSSSSPARRVASVRKGEILAELRTENFAEPFAMLRIAGLSAQAAKRPRGVGARPNCLGW